MATNATIINEAIKELEDARDDVLDTRADLLFEIIEREAKLEVLYTQVALSEEFAGSIGDAIITLTDQL